MSIAAPAIDWADDVKRYVPDADTGAIAALVHHCLVSQKTREAPLVSFANPSDTRSVRDNFCRKTLGLTETDGVLDAAIAAVGARMSDTTSRHRVTAYYLLAEHFGKVGELAAAAAAMPPLPVPPILAPWAATRFEGPPPGTAGADLRPATEAPAVDWADDVKRYVPGADTGAIAALVHHCLVSQKTREAPLVSFANPSDTRSVRDKFCRKTLGLTESDSVLDAAIASVGVRMSDTTSRHRVTAYYLLAEHFGKVAELAAAAAAMPPAPVPPILAPWAASMFDGPPPGTAGADLRPANDAPAMDWADDVKRYVPDADTGAIAALVHHCLVSQKTREAPLVSFANPSDTRSVRDNFCRKTLGLTESDGVLDAAIASVGARMSDTTSRHRVTAYYLLAEHFGKVGELAAAAMPLAPAARPLAPWAATRFDGPPPGTASGAPSSDLRFAGFVGLGVAALAVSGAVASHAGG